MKISGDLFIIVDEVAIEQIGIENPDCVLMQSRAYRAQAAARQDRRIESLSKILFEIDHTLEFYRGIDVLGKGIKIFFKIRQKTYEEIIHG